MSSKKRLAKIEQDITQEIREKEAEESRRAAAFFRTFHLPLPSQASQEERNEVKTRLLTLHAKVHAGTVTPADEAGWFQWVDGVHAKYGSTPQA